MTTFVTVEVTFTESEYRRLRRKVGFSSSGLSEFAVREAMGLRGEAYGIRRSRRLNGNADIQTEAEYLEQMGEP
jgi:hypothetical protein